MARPVRRLLLHIGCVIAVCKEREEIFERKREEGGGERKKKVKEEGLWQ